MKNKQTILRWLVMLNLSFYGYQGFSYTFSPDTIYVKAGSYIILRNSLVFIKNDTMIITEKSEHDHKLENQIEKSQEFYSIIEQKASKNKITRELVGLIIRPSGLGSSPDTVSIHLSELRFFPYSGKLIRNIRICQLDVFGTSVFDTSLYLANWTGRTANKVHVNTHRKIIVNNLIFKAGDAIDPLVFADNERLLRNLPFIEDARIEIQPLALDTSWVDITVITKDVWSIGVEWQISDQYKGHIDVFDKNILGTAHHQENNIYYDTRKNPSWGYQGIYKINNIEGTFINAKASYYTFGFDQACGVSFNRDFFTPETRYAGGVDIMYNKNQLNIKLGQLSGEQPVINTIYDFWMGKSIKFRKVNLRGTSRPRIIVKTRITLKDYSDRPKISQDSNSQYFNTKRVLVSIGFSQQRYYTGSMIYRFGRTEDIPRGNLYEITSGIESDEFKDRYYLGFLFSKAGFVDQMGYLDVKAIASTYIFRSNYEQSIIKLEGQYFSNLVYLGDLKLRQFVTVGYTHGIRRKSDEGLMINDSRGIRDFSADSLFGNHRLNFRLETVLFPTWYFYGFGSAVFLFYDGSWLANQDIFYRNRYYSGIGLGFRIRNENLIFNSFEFRFAFYPHTVPGVKPFSAFFSNENSMAFPDFNISLPEVQRYE